MNHDPGIYDELGVPTVINGVGTRTQIGGTRMRDEAIAAMKSAADNFVYLTELQARAAETIADVTGAESGFVASGAAACMTLAAAACIARNDYSIMNRLPNSGDFANEIVIPTGHRITYDVAFRGAGAELVNVGKISHHPINGGVDVAEPWEIEDAITSSTAAVAYVQTPHNRISLSDVVSIAHDNDVPVIVDAAAELPPKANLRRFIDAGADLVVFSGGKAIRGPQCTGILAGSQELVQSAAIQQLSDGYHEALWDPPSNLIDRSTLPEGLPRYGIGRSLKVGREELVALLRALEAFVAEDDTQTLHEWDRRSRGMANRLESVSGVEATVTNLDDKERVSTVVVSLSNSVPIDAITLLQRLRNETPRIWLGERRVSHNAVTIDPRSMTDEEAVYVTDRIRSIVEGSSDPRSEVTDDEG